MMDAGADRGAFIGTVNTADSPGAHVGMVGGTVVVAWNMVIRNDFTVDQSVIMLAGYHELSQVPCQVASAVLVFNSGRHGLEVRLYST